VRPVIAVGVPALYPPLDDSSTTIMDDLRRDLDRLAAKIRQPAVTSGSGLHPTLQPTTALHEI
jgi:hypothetical protein